MSTSFSPSTSSSDAFPSTSAQSPSAETKSTTMSPTPQDKPPYIEARKFTTIADAKKGIDWQIERLMNGTSRSQYIMFRPVSESDFAILDKSRYDSRRMIPKSARLSYDTDTSSLIVKLMPSTCHEQAHRLLEGRMVVKIESFGEAASSTFMVPGAKGCEGKSSSKEPDSSYKPRSRGQEGWPTMIIESGWSESLAQLRCDASWWLVNSLGKVHIALIISLHQDDRTIVIETWEMSQPDEARRVTRSNAQQVPTRTQEISITKDAVQGAPLVLEFVKVFERAAVPPEGDIVFSAQELLVWAEKVWWEEKP
ncbi:hypothetical protein V500_08576 [Pseudogymnoascus sp. VKM F-4518 (FW-2643)]|nr:hypothetical protein V500_08576 [Pseudogymnoascus sp. VKM F-4518 (FW-2643)]